MQSINVNTKKCDCRLPDGAPYSVFYAYPDGGKGHMDDCSSRPVLIPCPLRDVTFTVRLGECDNDIRLMHIPGTVSRCGPTGGHHEKCPARGLRVACSISGNTWADSSITDVEMVGSGIYPNDAIRTACRERWALVVALVMNRDDAWAHGAPRSLPSLLSQRDAVFAALARLRATEIAGDDAMADLERAGIHPRTWNKRENSEAALDAYVESLIEQVGVLS